MQEHCPSPPAVVVGIDGSRSAVDAALWAVDEAVSRLRGGPLRVLTTWQSRFTDIHDGNAVADGNRLARAQLDRRLAPWKNRYPNLDVRAVAVHCGTLNFLTKNASSIQLLIVGHERAQGVTALVGPPGYAALHNADCSVLIREPQNVL
jgi:Universal stress protein family